jgi:hypothetical protein
MNQFVIDLPANPSGLRSAHAAVGDSRDSRIAAGRGGPFRPAWPFLVNNSSRNNRQALAPTPGSPSGFAS